MEASLSAKQLSLPGLERELRIVQEGIALVASGRSRRVVVAGLPDVPAFVDQVRRSATAAGVRVVPLDIVYAGFVDLALESAGP
jgi:hypothetical protein